MIPVAIAKAALDKAKDLSTLNAFITSFFLDVVNTLLEKAMRYFSEREKHNSITEFNISFSYKLTVARTLNNILVILATNYNPEKWFEIGGLSQTVTINVFYGAFKPQLMFLICPSEDATKFLKKKWY